MVRKGARRHIKDLTSLVTEIFSLPETSHQIIKVLCSCRKALSVKEIVDRVKRSERSVRSALGGLVSNGLLLRNVSITVSKRLAYKYTLGPLDRLVKVARSEILNRLETLERLEERLSNLRRSRQAQEG